MTLLMVPANRASKVQRPTSASSPNSAERQRMDEIESQGLADPRSEGNPPLGVMDDAAQLWNEPPSEAGAVGQRAYELWQAAGEPAGRDVEFWLQAEHDLAHPPKPRREVQPKSPAEARARA